MARSSIAPVEGQVREPEPEGQGRAAEQRREDRSEGHPGHQDEPRGAQAREEIAEGWRDDRLRLEDRDHDAGDAGHAEPDQDLSGDGDEEGPVLAETDSNSVRVLEQDGGPGSPAKLAAAVMAPRARAISPATVPSPATQLRRTLTFWSSSSSSPSTEVASRASVMSSCSAEGAVRVEVGLHVLGQQLRQRP